MTKPRDPDALLSAYLAVGMEVLPDRVVDSVLDEVHRTRQRAVFGPWRTRTMVRAVLSTAAVVAVVALGGAFALIGGPSPTPSADPRASLPAVLAPSSTPSGPSAGPTASPVTSPGGIWIATGTMNTPRYDHSAVRLLDGRVLVVGGSDAPHQDLTSAELYDPESGTWTATGSMATPMGFPAILLRDGSVLSGDQVYDPQDGTWTATGKMVAGGGAPTLLRDGKVLVTGNDGSELYDPDSRTWTATGEMTSPRHSHAAILLPDGKVLVAGGHAPGDAPTDSAELYDPATGIWTAIANMHVKREFIEAFLRPDGKVLVVGGPSGEPQSAELFDPATGAWTAVGDMSIGGPYQTATLLADGTVLLASARGGLGGAELFDPTTGVWTTTGTMLRSHPQSYHATLLLDGTVLVAGGSDCSADSTTCPTGATGSAELYIPAGVSPPALPAFPSPPPPVIPSPTPIPPPLPPEVGPVPAGARSWKVTVVNKSSVPATLFLAEDGENGSRQLCGSVTPNVVPAGVTEQVTFLLPPKNVRGCWIDVNPVRGDVPGSLFETSDAPMAGEILIREDGESGWLGP